MPARTLARHGSPAHGQGRSSAGPLPPRHWSGAPERAGQAGASLCSAEQSAEKAPAFRLDEAHFALLAEKTGDSIVISATRWALLVKHDGGPGIRGAQHRLR